MRAFPVFLRSEGRSIVVFGGGAEAAAKLRLVAKTNARVIVVAEALIENEIALGDAEWVREDPLSFVFPGDTVLAYAATGDLAFDAAIADHARRHHVLICAADQPGVSDFITPAIVDRDPVVIAIGTEGTAPVLARMIKGRIETLLPTMLGTVARVAEALREHVTHLLSPGGQRRAFWSQFFHDALDGDVASDTVLRDRATALLAGNDAMHVDQPDGFVSFVGAGPGGPDLMTLRARRVLDRADVVLHDALVAPDILELARREAILIDVGKRCGRHAFRQEHICDLIVHHARQGRHVVRLKGGDPSIFGRLAEELDVVVESGAPFEVVPGVTAAAAASASAAAPLTERGRTQELRVITAHGRDGDTDVDWASLARTDSAIAIYMGRGAATGIQRKLTLYGRAASTAVVLVENAGRPDEIVHHTTLSNLAAAAARTRKEVPLMMLIGVVSRISQAKLSTAADLAQPIAKAA